MTGIKPDGFVLRDTTVILKSEKGKSAIVKRSVFMRYYEGLRMGIKRYYKIPVPADTTKKVRKYALFSCRDTKMILFSNKKNRDLSLSCNLFVLFNDGFLKVITHFFKLLYPISIDHMVDHGTQSSEYDLICCLAFLSVFLQFAESALMIVQLIKGMFE